MINDSDLEVGQFYEIEIPDEDGPIVVEFRETTADGRFVFSQRYLNVPIMIDKFTWDGMRSSGAARLFGEDAYGNALPDDEIDPASLLNPDDPSITVREREKRLLAATRLDEARTLRFYVQRYDEDPSVGRGTVGVDRWILEHSKDAPKIKEPWLPSAGAVLRAEQKCGKPGYRPLSAFYDDRGKHDRAARWAL